MRGLLLTVWLGLTVYVASAQDIELTLWVKRIQLADSTQATCGREQVRILQEEKQLLFVSSIDTLVLYWQQSFHEVEATYKLWVDQLTGDAVLTTSYMEQGGHFLIIFVPARPVRLRHSIIVSTRENICKL